MKNNKIYTPGAAARTIVLATLALPLAAQSTRTGFVPFNNFLEQTRGSKMKAMIDPDTRVRETAAFEEMRAHILKLYEGVQVTHSYVIDSSHFDCVPENQQPAVRFLGITNPAAPPPASMAPSAANAKSDGAGGGEAYPAFHPASPVDDFGNSTTCEPNTIAMRRVTLEETSRYPSLREFFAKGPGEAGQAPVVEPAVTPAAASDGHSYAIYYDTVASTGGGTTINVWNPAANGNQGQMSLAQLWLTSGSGATRQTAEVGWQVQPAKWKTQATVLFTYYTADNYAGALCYNTDCGIFYQYKGTYPLGQGGVLTPSKIGGAQNEFTAQYVLYQGNWFLWVAGQWVGYYPGSAYKGGAMTRGADTIEFGTETAGATWPNAGSGNFAESGWSYAAYQRNMFYIDPSGKSYYPATGDFHPIQTNLSCYDVSQVKTNSSPDWAVYFFAGGPGGSNCK